MSMSFVNFRSCTKTLNISFRMLSRRDLFKNEHSQTVLATSGVHGAQVLNFANLGRFELQENFQRFFEECFLSAFLKIVKESLRTTDGTLVGRFQAKPAGSDCTLPCSNHFTVSIFCVQKGSQNIDKIWSTKLPTLL